MSDCNLGGQPVADPRSVSSMCLHLFTAGRTDGHRSKVSTGKLPPVLHPLLQRVAGVLCAVAGGEHPFATAVDLIDHR